MGISTNAKHSLVSITELFLLRYMELPSNESNSEIVFIFSIFVIFATLVQIIKGVNCSTQLFKHQGKKKMKIRLIYLVKMTNKEVFDNTYDSDIAKVLIPALKTILNLGY